MATRPEGLCVECPKFEQCPTKGDLRTNTGKLAYQLGDILLSEGGCNGPVYDTSMKEMLGKDPKCGNPNFDDATGIMFTVQTYEWNKRN